MQNSVTSVAVIVSSVPILLFIGNMLLHVLAFVFCTLWVFRASVCKLWKVRATLAPWHCEPDTRESSLRWFGSESSIEWCLPCMSQSAWSFSSVLFQAKRPQWTKICRRIHGGAQTHSVSQLFSGKSRGIKRDKVNGTNGAKFADFADFGLIFADCRFS